jgi:alkylation response protein AidB-like acyl-CoA dehydrogenase
VARQTEIDGSDDALLDSIEKWLERDVRPYVLELDHADEYPFKMVEQMKELGLFGATISQEHGGLGLSATTYAKIVEKIAETWMSLSGIINSHLIMAACVQRHGTPEQKAHYLPKFATGEIRGGLALTEPDAGTDLQGIRTRATRSGNGYVINGTKTWIKTDPDADPRHKGMSCFIAEKAPGFTASKKLEKLGYKGIDSAELVFDDYRISGGQLLGGEEGRGMQAVLGGLELGRINIAARGCGLASAALKDAVKYSQIRRTFGKPICEHQAIQLKLGEMATRLQAARLLTYDAARAYDGGERCDMEAGMAKFFASEAAVENSLESMRIHGAYGYSKEYHVERYFRDAPLMCIGEGTNEIQRMIIAKQLIERNRV